MSIIWLPALSMARMSSFNLRLMARASRFWVFWMMKTMRKVTMVVPVLMTSCQVSEKWKTGPVTAQTRMIRVAPAKAHVEPSQPEAEAANLPNQSFVVRAFTSNGISFIFASEEIFKLFKSDADIRGWELSEYPGGECWIILLA
jgi:hypothetical protein